VRTIDRKGQSLFDPYSGEIANKIVLVLSRQKNFHVEPVEDLGTVTEGTDNELTGRHRVGGNYRQVPKLLSLRSERRLARNVPLVSVLDSKHSAPIAAVQHDRVDGDFSILSLRNSLIDAIKSRVSSVRELRIERRSLGDDAMDVLPGSVAEQQLLIFH